jgi:hypothetical protein
MTGLISALTGSGQSTRKSAKVILAPLDQEAQIDNSLGGAKALQFFPESLGWSKTQNWQPKESPGLNNPLYQWINGSERPFNFTVNFSRDMHGVIGGDIEEDKYNVDINSAIAWLQLLSHSTYEKKSDMTVAVAPPVVWMHFVGTHLSWLESFKNLVSDENGSGVYCIITEVAPEITKWFNPGTPKKAEVSITAVETIQYGGNVHAYGREGLLKMSENYRRSAT